MKHITIKVLLLCIFAIPCAAQPLRFHITDGKTQQDVTDSIRVQQKQLPSTIADTYLYTIKNTSAQQRFLYLNWTISFTSPHPINNIHYWDGRGEPLSGNALLQKPSQNANDTTSMLQAVYDDAQGIALALPPDQIVSQFTQSLEVANDKSYSLHLQIPLVLDAGQSDTFPIEIYHFTPRYGFLDALQKYFSAHPESFNPRSNIDPRAAGVGDASIVRPALSISEARASEIARRYYADWDWVYAPFKRTGDIYGREQFWNYVPARPNDRRIKKGTPAQYHAERATQLNQLDKVVSAAFYTPAFLYCEVQLANKEYPDAIIKNADGSYYKYYKTPWVTGPDNEVEMYPWGNKFARQSMEDAKQLVAENNITAFGYDVMGGGAKFRGKGLDESPRRAFDEKGAYSDTSVAIAKMADFTRSLTKNGRETALVGNIVGGSRAFLVARSDSIMFEQPPYYHASDFIATRYAAGHKLITIWNPWRLVNVLQWKSMSPEQLQEAFHGAADYMRLTAFRYGAFPSPRWSSGVPKIMQMLPLLKDIISQGWQAVPAARRANGALPEHIWPARYGNGTGSYITIGNASKTAWSGEVIIDNDYLGTSNYLFADVNGKVLSQTVKGRTTLLQVEIASHETLILRAVAAIPANTSGNATLSWNDDGANGTLNIKSTFTPTKVLSPRDGWKLAKQDGQTWNFDSLYFASPLKDIVEFPYFGEGTVDKVVTAQIVLPQNATDKDRADAKRLQEYFKFWGQEGIKPAKDLALPIIPSIPVSTMGSKIYIGNSMTRRQGNTLYVGNVAQLLNALDQKYFYYGTMNPGPSGADVFKKANIDGGVLRDK